MSMSRKDFNLIAATFATYAAEVKNEQETRTDSYTLTHLAGERAALVTLAARLATELKQANPAFDAQRFIEACGAN